MNLRQAAQQALEALEWAWGGNALTGKEMVAIAALRAALAEPDSDYERGFVDGMNLQTKGSVDKAVNRIAEPEQKGWFTIQEANEWAAKLPQTTHWEGCEAVHPECRKPEQEPVLEVRCFGEKRVFVTLVPVEQLKDGEKLYRGLSQEKPVGYFRLEQGIWYQYHEDDAHPETLTPLYTAPTSRKPLTDEEIDRITDQQWGQDNHKPIYAAHRAYARAIERAHGIGEQHE